MLTPRLMRWMIRSVIQESEIHWIQLPNFKRAAGALPCSCASVRQPIPQPIPSGVVRPNSLALDWNWEPDGGNHTRGECTCVVDQT